MEEICALYALTSNFTRGESLEEIKGLTEEKYPAQDDNYDILTAGSNNKEETKDDNLRSLKNSHLEGTSLQTEPTEDEKDLDQRENASKQFNEIKEGPSSLDGSRTIGSFIQRAINRLQTTLGLRKGTEKEEVKIKSTPSSVVASSKTEVVADTSFSEILTRFESDSLEGRFIMKLERRFANLENLIPQYHTRHEEDAIFKQKLQEKIHLLESQLEEEEVFKQKLQKEIDQLASQLQERDHYRQNDQETTKQAAKMAQLRKTSENEKEAVHQDHSHEHAQLKEVDSGGGKTEKKVAKDDYSHLKESCCSKEMVEVTAAELQSQLVKEVHRLKESIGKELQDTKRKTDRHLETIERKVGEHALQLGELNFRQEEREKTMAQLHSKVNEKDHQKENKEQEIQDAKELLKEIDKRVEGNEKKVAEYALQLDKMSSRMEEIEKTNAQFHSQMVKETNHQLEKMEKEIRDLKELMKGICQRTEKVEKKQADQGSHLEDMDSRVERMKTAIDQFHLQLEELRSFLEEKMRNEMRDVVDEVENQRVFLSTHEENMALLRRALGNFNLMFRRDVNNLNRRVDTLLVSNGPVVPNGVG